MSSSRWTRPETGLRPRAEAPADADLLRSRLERLGLRRIDRLRLTENRSVLVSFSRRRVLSLHRGYARAPESVLEAIVRFVAAGTPREARKSAERAIVAYHAESGDREGRLPRAARRAERQRPEDAPVLERLERLFTEHNARYFDDTLAAPQIRLSARMRSRLGHLTLGRDGRPIAITISRRHLASHGWDEVAHTLLHEMVHLWQHAGGHRVDHGPLFRAKAREVGAHAAARRWIQRDRAARRL